MGFCTVVQTSRSFKLEKSIQYLLYLMILISPMLVIQIKGKELFLWLQVLFVVLVSFRCNRISVMKSPLILLIFIEPFIAAFFAYFSMMPDKYKKTAIDLAIMAIPLYFVMSYIEMFIKNRYRIIEVIIKAFKMAVIIEAIWIPIQFVLYKGFDLDINKRIFVDILHMVQNASFIRSWVWYPSGLSWHSAVLAPLFVLGILLFDNTAFRTLILFDSFICGNSTTLLGVCMCLLLLMIRRIYLDRIKITNVEKTEIILLILFIILALCTTNIGSKLYEVVLKLWTRLFGTEKDASTAAHLGYYTDYLKIIKSSSPLQVIFGYGYGCSGYTITKLYGRYADGGTWAIECDYINILVSRGIIGFLSYYAFMFYVMIKGIRQDIRYFIFIFVVLFQGLGYNIQFDYLFLIEVVLFITVNNNINFFEIVDNINNNKRKKRWLKFR